MKNLTLFLALFFTALGSARAADFPVEVKAPANWKQDGASGMSGPMGDWPTVRYIPADGRNAAVLLSVLPSTAIKDLATLRAGHDKRIEFQVGKGQVGKTNEVRFGGGTLVYSTHEDPALVGKPEKKDDYKYATLAEVLLTDGTPVLASVFTNEEKGPSVEEGLAILKSLRPKPKPGERKQKEGAGIDGEVLRLTFPGLDGALNAPYAGFQPIPQNRVTDPSYFAYGRPDGLEFTGWLQPIAKYPGFRRLWETDKERIEMGLRIKLEEEAFGELFGWQYVSYSVRLADGGVQLNIRACRTWGHTWANIHLATVNPNHRLADLTSFLSKLNMSAAGTPANAARPPVSESKPGATPGAGASVAPAKK